MYSGLQRAGFLGGKPSLAPPSGNLELFFDGDFVTYGATVTAVNQAPSGATRDATQSTAANQPTAGTALNGHGTVHHDGSNDFLGGVFGGGGLAVGNPNPHTIVVLSKRPGVGGDKAFFDSAPGTFTNTGIALLHESGSILHRLAGSGPLYSFTGANWVVHFGVQSGTTLSLYEGTTLKNTAVVAATATLQNFRIGSLIGGGYALDGDWAQVLLYGRAFDSTDRNNYLAYVNTRYGLSLT